MPTINQQDVTAVILAGGKGRRLKGQDKGLVNYKSKPLIEHVLEGITPQVKSVLINANRNIETYQAYGHPVINDELSDFQGPLAGFATAMKVADTPYIVTLPCDGPIVATDLVSRFIETLKTALSPETLVVAHDGKRHQPVYALLPVATLDSLQFFLGNGDRKIDLWFKNHPVLYADFSDKPDVFSNINTEEQRQVMEKND